MLRTPVRFAVAAALVLVAVAACKDLIAPGDEPYDLKSIAGVPLPAPYAPNPNFNGRIFASSLSLGKNGRGSWNYTAESEVGGSQYTSSQGFSYTRSGNTVTIQLDCPDLGSCIAGPHLVGTLGERRINFETSNVMRVPLVYEAAFTGPR